MGSFFLVARILSGVLTCGVRLTREVRHVSILGLDTIIVRDVNLGASSDLAPTDETPVLVHTSAQSDLLLFLWGQREGCE